MQMNIHNPLPLLLNCTRAKSYRTPHVIDEEYQITFHPDAIILWRLKERLGVPTWSKMDICLLDRYAHGDKKYKVVQVKYFIRPGHVLDAWIHFKEQSIALPGASYDKIISKVPELEPYYTITTKGETRIEFNFQWSGTENELWIESTQFNLALLQRCYNSVSDDLKPEVQLNIEWLSFLHQLELEDPEHKNLSGRWVKFMNRFLFSNPNTDEYEDIIYAIYYYFVRAQYWYRDYTIFLTSDENGLDEAIIHFSDSDEAPLKLTDEEWKHYKPYLKVHYHMYAPVIISEDDS